MPTLSPFATQVLDAVATLQEPTGPARVVAADADHIALTLGKPTATVARTLNRLEEAGLVRAVALPGLTVPGYVPVEEEPVEAPAESPADALTEILTGGTVREVRNHLFDYTAQDVPLVEGGPTVREVRSALHEIGPQDAPLTGGDLHAILDRFGLTPVTLAESRVLGVLSATEPRTPADVKRLLPGETPVVLLRSVLGRLAAKGLATPVERASGPTAYALTSAALVRELDAPAKPASGTDAARTASLLEEYEGRILPARRQSLQEAQEAHREAIRQHEDLKADVEALRAVLRRLEAQETEALEARKRAETAVADLRADVRDATEKVEALRRGDAS